MIVSGGTMLKLIEVMPECKAGIHCNISETANLYLMHGIAASTQYQINIVSTLVVSDAWSYVWMIKTGKTKEEHCCKYVLCPLQYQSNPYMSVVSHTGGMYFCQCDQRVFISYIYFV